MKQKKQRKISDFYQPPALFDSPVPDLQEPVLQPTKAEPKYFAERIKNKLSKCKADFTRRVEVGLSRVKSEIDSLTDWLNDQVRKQLVKPVNEKLEAFKATINKLYSNKDTRDNLKLKKASQH